MASLDPNKQYISDETKSLFGDQALIGGFDINYGGQSYKIQDNNNGTRSFALNAPAAPSVPAGGGGGGLGTGGFTFNQPTLDLPSLYEKLYASSGIEGQQTDITQKGQEKAKALSTINDNPWLSEGDRIGRGAKLETDYQNRIKPIQDSINMKRADLETKLNLQTKQFDIDSQQARDARDQFNSLLSAGALDNASGDDIAQITKATGIPSGLIQSAIKSRTDATAFEKQKYNDSQTLEKAKLNAVDPSVVTSTDDSGNVTVSVIDQKTGKLISQQSLGAISTTKKATGGATATKENEKTQNTNNLITDVKAKVTLRSLVNHYSGVLSIDDIYRLYNSYSPWGKARETLAEVKQGLFKTK